MEEVSLSATQTRLSASTLERVLAAAGVIGASIGVFFVSYFDPVTAGFFPVCPLYKMTGFNCPGCGLTRGFHALFHGDILTALDYNALIPFYAFFLGYLTISLTLLAVRGSGLSWKIFKPWAMYGFIALLLIFGITRNLPFYPFNILAP